MYGLSRLLHELRELGYAVDEAVAQGTRFAILSAFQVPCGQFADRVIDLGIPATPDFPRTVASSIHVRAEPQLFDYGDTQPGKRNIIRSPLGPEWRYWSHNFQWRGQDRGARRLMSQIHGIFSHA
jgi:hypothetical protein